MSKYKTLFNQVLEYKASEVSTKQYYQSLNNYLKSRNMTLGKNKWDKTGIVDSSQVGIYSIPTGEQIGKIKRVISSGLLTLDHISSKEKGYGLVRKVYPHDEQFARKHKLEVYSELVNEYTEDMFHHIFSKWSIEPREGEGAYQAMLESMTAGAGGVFGDAPSMGHGGAVGNTDFYATGDARLPKGGVTISRFGKVGKKKRKKKKKSIYEREDGLQDTLKTYKALKKPKQPRDQYDPIELFKGTQVEMEHTTDRSVAEIITMNHLDEDPEYYTKLKKVEQDNPVLEAHEDYNDRVAKSMGFKPYWHQTTEEFDIADFDVSNKYGSSGGALEHNIPSGVYLKDFEDQILVRGEVQIKVYFKPDDLLVVKDRQDLSNFLREHMAGFSDMEDSLFKIRETGISQLQQSQDIATDAQALQVRYNKRAKDIKLKVNDFFKKQKYNGIVIKDDRGITTTIVFDPSQIKKVEG